MSLDNESSTYKITSQVGNETFEIEVPFDYLTLSTVINEQVRLDPSSRLFEAKDVTKETLYAVKEYLEHHKGQLPTPIPSPLKSNNLADAGVSPWDVSFIDRIYNGGTAIGHTELKSLGHAALLLDIKPLFELICAKWASLIRGKSLAEARNILGSKK